MRQVRDNVNSILTVVILVSVVYTIAHVVRDMI